MKERELGSNHHVIAYMILFPGSRGIKHELTPTAEEL